MDHRAAISIAFGISFFIGFSQSSSVRINNGIKLPKDSIESKELIASLNEFLNSSQKPNEENKWVLESELVETYVLTDEIRNIQRDDKSGRENFYQPYLVNVTKLNEYRYNLQLEYQGFMNDTVYTRANFEILAHKTADKFLFSSMLFSNTASWKTKHIGNNTFHYQNALNKKHVREFCNLAQVFDKKLNAQNKSVEFYCCANMTELGKLIGMQYKSDYNGRAGGVLSASGGARKVVVLGNNNAFFDHYDKHDLWHDRLSLVVPRSKVNKSVDEGCAYLYGGSWGLSWDEIFRAFAEQVATDRNTDWTAIKENPVYFKTKGYSNSADYIVNALIVKKLEKDKGFDGVWELLNCGKTEQGNRNYYDALEKLTGIKKGEYNKMVWELVDSENGK